MNWIIYRIRFQLNCRDLSKDGSYHPVGSARHQARDSHLLGLWVGKSEWWLNTVEVLKVGTEKMLLIEMKITSTLFIWSPFMLLHTGEWVHGGRVQDIRGAPEEDQPQHPLHHLRHQPALWFHRSGLPMVGWLLFCVIEDWIEVCLAFTPVTGSCEG